MRPASKPVLMKRLFIALVLVVCVLLIAPSALARTCTTTKYASNDWETVCDDGWSLRYNPLDPYTFMMQCCWFDMEQRSFNAMFPNYSSGSTVMETASKKVANSAGGGVCPSCATISGLGAQPTIKPVVMPSYTPSAAITGKIAITTQGTKFGKNTTAFAKILGKSSKGSFAAAKLWK